MMRKFCTSLQDHHKIKYGQSSKHFSVVQSVQTTKNHGHGSIIIFDVMDTIVKDPFFTHVAPFFGLEFDQLIQQKHPTAWVEFEKNLISEEELFSRFFADRRKIDGKALLECMIGGYSYIEGMPELLIKLKTLGHSLHACSNYPVWYRHIDDKLHLGQYIQWTFMSCKGPMEGLHKPSSKAFDVVKSYFSCCDPYQLIFIDDREANVEAAKAAGLQSIQFFDVEKLQQELIERNIIV